jgi:hypothetical protein
LACVVCVRVCVARGDTQAYWDETLQREKARREKSSAETAQQAKDRCVWGVGSGPRAARLIFMRPWQSTHVATGISDLPCATYRRSQPTRSSSQLTRGEGCGDAHSMRWLKQRRAEHEAKLERELREKKALWARRVAEQKTDQEVRAAIRFEQHRRWERETEARHVDIEEKVKERRAKYRASMGLR